MKVKCGAEKEERKVISSIPHLQLQNAHNSLLIGLTQPFARGCCIPFHFHTLSSLSLSPHNNCNKWVPSVYAQHLINCSYILLTYILQIHNKIINQHYSTSRFLFSSLFTLFSPFLSHYPFPFLNKPSCFCFFSSHHQHGVCPSSWIRATNITHSALTLEAKGLRQVC